MSKDKYEKHIAFLEEKIQTLSESNHKLEEQLSLSEEKILADRGEYLGKLTAFLNKIYGDLGRIQAGVLRELHNLNQQQSDVANTKMKKALQMLEMLAPEIVTSLAEDKKNES